MPSVFLFFVFKTKAFPITQRSSISTDIYLTKIIMIMCGTKTMIILI